jgi:hypothetical protein
MAEITGTINVPRRRFNGNGLTGVVEFGRTWTSGRSGRMTMTPVRVQLSDGSEAVGKYRDPLNVVLKIKEKRRKYRQP